MEYMAPHRPTAHLSHAADDRLGTQSSSTSAAPYFASRNAEARPPGHHPQQSHRVADVDPPDRTDKSQRFDGAARAFRLAPLSIQIITESEFEQLSPPFMTEPPLYTGRAMAGDSRDTPPSQAARLANHSSTVLGTRVILY